MVASWVKRKYNGDELNDKKLQQFRVRQRLENVHIYLWIAKDFAWASENRDLGLIFGTAALLWLGVILVYALAQRDSEEAVVLVATLLWLWSNFWWMAGEIGICGSSTVNSREALVTFVLALAWILVYFLFLRPCGLVRPDDVGVQHYESQGLYARFSFRSFREYEYLHTLFWIIKDLSWNRVYKPAFYVAAVFTLILGADFVYLTAREGKHFECLHYLAQLLWVAANAVWAVAELQHGRDEPYPLFQSDDPRRFDTGRWWAQLIMVLAMVPIIIAYLICLPLELFFSGQQQRRSSSTETDSLLSPQKKHSRHPPPPPTKNKNIFLV